MYNLIATCIIEAKAFGKNVNGLVKAFTKDNDTKATCGSSVCVVLSAVYVEKATTEN